MSDQTKKIRDVMKWNETNKSDNITRINKW